MSGGALVRDRIREGDKGAQYSSSKPDLIGSESSLLNISKEAPLDQRDPKPDPNFDGEREDQEVDG